MSSVKNHHSIGEGSGAVAGAITGAAVGGIVGAKTGGALAELVNPTDYTTCFPNSYRTAPYYPAGAGWSDYEPAGKYGYDSYESLRGRRFEDVESELEAAGTRRGATASSPGATPGRPCANGWHHIERALPGDADRDGRQLMVTDIRRFRSD